MFSHRSSFISQKSAKTISKEQTSFSVLLLVFENFNWNNVATFNYEFKETLNLSQRCHAIGQDYSWTHDEN